MDVHRCRFVRYPPSAINSIAFSHSSSNKSTEQRQKDLRLAVGRADGHIEIWNPSGGDWFQETVFGGGKDRTIDALAWVHDQQDQVEEGAANGLGKLRLFSIGHSTALTEWDLAQGVPLRHCDATQSEAWCIAVQPPAESESGMNGLKTTPVAEGQDVAIGCANGTIALISTTNDDLVFRRQLTPPGSPRARVLCMTFQSRHVLIAGYADSKVRIFNTRNGGLIRTISFGSSSKSKGGRVFVWTVKCLPDGTIITGDSNGEVRIWDGKLYTATQRMKSHLADVLCLEVSADGKKIISGGMDCRTVVYQQQTGISAGISRRWTEIFHRRYHTHDVKSMTSYESAGLSVVVSGGLDTSLIVLPFRNIGDELHRVLPHLPQRGPLCSCDQGRLLISWWDREVNIWTIEDLNEIERMTKSERETQCRRLIGKILIQGDESITSVSIPSSGGFIFVSTVSQTKLFSLSLSSGAKHSLKAKRVTLPHSFTSQGAKLLSVSPDGLWIAKVSLANELLITRIVRNTRPNECFIALSRTFRLRRSRPPSEINHGSLGSYKRVISQMAFSSDSKILVVGDLSGNIDSWFLDLNEDNAEFSRVQVDAMSTSSYSDASEDYDATFSEGRPNGTMGSCRERWRIYRNRPSLRLSSAPLVLEFRPTLRKPKMLTNGDIPHNVSDALVDNADLLDDGEDRLIIITAQHEILEYSVNEGTFTAWTRRNPKSSFPFEFLNLSDRTKCCIWDIRAGIERLWLFGAKWVWMFDLSRDITAPVDGAKALTNGDVDDKTKTITTTTVVKVLTNGTVSDKGTPNSAMPLSIGKKRKRRDTNGAGGKIDAAEAPAGIPFHSNRIAVGKDQFGVIGKDEAQTEIMPVSEGPGDMSENEDHDMDSEQDDLATSRRDLARRATGFGTDVASIQGSNEGRPWWFTYKYQPILGAVSLNRSEEEFEVAIVERPLWETDLPPRYRKEQDWGKT